MKKINFILFAALFLTMEINAQDPQLSNTNQSLVYLNPGFAGSNGGVRTQSSYRNQWPNLSANYAILLNSVDAFIKPLNGGVAVTHFADDRASGTFKTSVFSLSYAQYLSCMEGLLKVIPSVKTSYGQRRVDLASLTFSQLPAGYTPATLHHRKTYLDISTGVLVNYKSDLYVGAYAFHLNRPDEGLFGDAKMPMRFLFHASYTIHLTDRTHLQLFYRTDRQTGFSHLGSASLICRDHFVTGLGYSSGVTPFVNVGYKKSAFSLLLSYERGFGRLEGKNSGAWELHAAFSLKNKAAGRTMESFERF